MGWKGRQGGAQQSWAAPLLQFCRAAELRRQRRHGDCKPESWERWSKGA